MSASSGRDRQLALPLAPTASVGFIAAASNEAARRWLSNVQDWSNWRLALWGEIGTGKTSLARLWLGKDGVLIPGGVLQGLPMPPAAHRLAVDDADCCKDEAALLHLLNFCGETRQPVLLTGRQAPARWTVALPDLASRLRAIQAVGIGPPDDRLLRAVLARLLAERQLQVAESVQEWLLRRLPRTIPALQQAANLLDELSLAEQHAITRPLAAAALRGLLPKDDGANDSASESGTSENTGTGDAG